MPECPIRAPFASLARFMPQNISSKSFFFQQAKVFCQTKSSKKKERGKQNPKSISKCCKWAKNVANIAVGRWSSKTAKIEMKITHCGCGSSISIWAAILHVPHAPFAILCSPFAICHFPFSRISKSLRLCILFMSHRSTLLVIFCSICAAAQRWRRRQDNKKNYFHFIQLEHI